MTLTHDWSVVVDVLVYVMDALDGAWIGAFLSVDNEVVSAALHLGVFSEAPTVSTESQSQSWLAVHLRVCGDCL